MTMAPRGQSMVRPPAKPRWLNGNLAEIARIWPGLRPGKVRKARVYSMTPGSAYVYNEGVLHSPSRTAPTRLIRVEGVNLDQFRALRPEYVEVA